MVEGDRATIVLGLICVIHAEFGIICEFSGSSHSLLMTLKFSTSNFSVHLLCCAISKLVDGTSRAYQEGRGCMMAQHVQYSPRTKTFLDVPSAARLAGFSIRHFRRIIEEDKIPIMQIGRKFFIVAANFETWKATHGQKRVGSCLQN